MLSGAVALLPGSSTLPEDSVIVMFGRHSGLGDHFFAPVTGFAAGALLAVSATCALAVLGSRIDGPSSARR